MPRWYDELSSGRPLYGPVKDFPLPEREVLEPQGILSIVVVLVQIRDRFWGFIGFDQCSVEYVWTVVEMSTHTQRCTEEILSLVELYRLLKRLAKLEIYTCSQSNKVLTVSSNESSTSGIGSRAAALSKNSILLSARKTKTVLSCGSINQPS